MHTPSTARPSRRASTAALFSVLLAALVAAGCAVNPATGHKEFTLVSAGQEEAIGREGFGAAVAEYGRYDDARLAAYVDSVGQRVAKASDQPALAWHFTLLDDPVVNAFAMPGGYIYVTRGILAHLNSEAQLAGVLGHEIGHVTARHSARQITKQQLAGFGLVLAGTFSQTFQRYSGAAQQALGLLMLKYGRDDETQADALGIRYAAAAGYDPREVPATYAMLKRIGERAGGALPFYLSTHPDPGDREQRTTALAAKAVAGRSGLVVRDRPYLERVRGIVFGDDPRDGWLDGGHYVHPALGFELDLPPGWNASNGHSALVAAEPRQLGALQWSLAADAAALAPKDYVAALRRDGRIASLEGAEDLIGGWPAWVGRVGVPAEGGATRVLVAAWVRLGDGRMLQCLGQSAAVADASERAIIVGVRTLRPLTEAHRLAEPERLRVRAATAAGTLQSLLEKLGPMPVPIEDLAILNGLEASSRVASGRWIKSVEGGRR